MDLCKMQRAGKHALLGFPLAAREHYHSPKGLTSNDNGHHAFEIASNEFWESRRDVICAPTVSFLTFAGSNNRSDWLAAGCLYMCHFHPRPSIIDRVYCQT